MTDPEFEVAGWVLTYHRPDVEEPCFAGPFPTEADAWDYAKLLPWKIGFGATVGQGTLRLTLKSPNPGS